MQHNTPVEWMELQVVQTTAMALIQRKQAVPYIRSLLESSGGQRTPETMSRLVRTVAMNYGTSIQMTRIRMIELGYPEAEGVFNFIDGQYIPDHGCCGEWPTGRTFCISLEDLTSFRMKDPFFNRMLATGRYRYVETHVCINDPLFIEGNHLSDYAHHNIDQCCFSFEVHGRKGNAEYEYDAVAYRKSRPARKDDEYITNYTCAIAPLGEEDRLDLFLNDGIRWGQLTEKMTGKPFKEMAKIAVGALGPTQEEIALRSGVSQALISSIINSPHPSCRHVVGFCILCNMPYYVATMLLEAANCKLSVHNPAHRLYMHFLSNPEVLTIQQCCEILVRKKYDPLFDLKDACIGK
ncbi:MAG: hypothetical protein IJI45_08045 [Anaerolineaceae bacterium]|nr:hypothetical protein [Anaerolineaceae bacterium]